MNMKPQEIDAFLGLTDDLTEAKSHWFRWRDTDGVGHDAGWEWATYTVALCVGRCHLYAISVDIDGIVIPEKLVDGLFHRTWSEVNRIARMLHGEREVLSDLPSLHDSVETEFTALDVLESRLHFEGLRSIFANDKTRFLTVADSKIHRQKTDVFSQQLEKLDELIDQHTSQLAIISESNWAQNINALLADNVYQPRPWWLTDSAADLLDQHRSLMGKLLSPEIGGVIQASFQPNLTHENWQSFFVSQDVSLNTVVGKSESQSRTVRKSADDPSLAPGEIGDLTLAAAQESAAAQFNLAAFFSQPVKESWNPSSKGELTIHTHLSMSSDFQDVTSDNLGDQLNCNLQVILTRRKFHDKNAQASETWRIRWGRWIEDLVFQPLSGALLPGYGEWKSQTQLTLGQLRDIVRFGRWEHQSWRQTD